MVYNLRVLIININNNNNNNNITTALTALNITACVSALMKNISVAKKSSCVGSLLGCVWNVTAHAKRTSPFKSAGASVQSTIGSRGVRISVSNAGYTVFRGSVRVLATHSIRQFPLHFSSRASPCAVRFQLDSTSNKQEVNTWLSPSAFSYFTKNVNTFH
jgi:ribosomal protein L31